MAVLFCVLCLILLAAFLWQRRSYKKLQEEVCYIGERLETLSITSENGFVLLPTDHGCVKEMVSSINGLLQEFYSSKLEYERAKKAMAQVLTNISHDIRTPLTVLKGNSEILVSRTKDRDVPEQLRRMADKIDEKADELVATINDYFTMSRISSGDFPLNLKQKNISRLCHEIILGYYDFLEEQEFTVDLQMPESPVFAVTDSDALSRILKNLIDNAIRHGGSGKYLALRLSEQKEKVIIEVEDHGAGIPSDQQKKIFSRNYTTARKSYGNGLGLAISQNLARQMGADLTVSNVPSEKTIFSVILKS